MLRHQRDGIERQQIQLLFKPAGSRRCDDRNRNCRRYPVRHRSTAPVTTRRGSQRDRHDHRVLRLLHLRNRHRAGVGQALLPQSDPLAGTLQAYAVFFVGFIARPVGAAIFGHYGNLPRSSPAARCRSSPRRCSPSSNRAMRSPSTSSAALSSALSPPRCSPTTPTGTSRRNRQIPLQQPVDREQGHEGHAEPLEEADVRLAPAAEFALIGALNPPRAVTQYFRQFRRRRFANILRAA